MEFCKNKVDKVMNYQGINISRPINAAEEVYPK